MFKEILDEKLPEPENLPMNTPEDIDRAANLITEAIEEADEKAIPRRKVTSLLKKLPPNLRHLVRIKRNLVKRCSTVTDNNEKSDLLDEVKNLENIINAKTDNVVREEWRKACDNLNAVTDSKKYWKHFSQLVGKFKSKVFADLKQGDLVATTDEERSNFFAQHMSNVCQTLTGDHYDENHKNKVEDTIEENKYIFTPLTGREETHDAQNDPNDISDPNIKVVRTISEKEVKEAIKSTPNKAPGDKVYAQHLKHHTPELITIITKIYNASLKLGYFPERWKQSVVTMILKPDKDASLPTSYRPISLLPILGKVFERIMIVRITIFFYEKKIFNMYQAGFQKGKSTMHHQKKQN